VVLETEDDAIRVHLRARTGAHRCLQ
jgi:hypothetical protein